jgi:hypothetical protein
MATQLNQDEPGESLRDALDAAFEQHSEDDTGADAPAVAKAAPAAPADEGTTDDLGRVRDASGRFAPKPGEVQPPAAAAPVQAPAGAPAAPAAAELKPPASWTPAAREKWAALDPDIRAEVHRREGEAQRVLQQSAQSRQFVDAFENVVRPFEVFIRSENASPLQAVQNLMSTAAEFRVGTPARKVELVAGIIKNFGIDLQALDSVLAGEVPQGGGQQQQQYRDPRVDQLLASQQQREQQLSQKATADAHAALTAFAQSHEFYNDVQNTMADLMELKAKRGEPIDLEKAYAQACNLHEDISTLLAQRAAANPNANRGTSANANAVLRAKRAAVSVKGDVTPNTGAHIPKDDSVRASIEAAMNSLQE